MRDKAKERLLGSVQTQKMGRGGGKVRMKGRFLSLPNSLFLLPLFPFLFRLLPRQHEKQVLSFFFACLKNAKNNTFEDYDLALKNGKIDHLLIKWLSNGPHRDAPLPGRCVVVQCLQFHPWFKFYFHLFWGMVMYNKLRIRLNHNRYFTKKP